MSDLRFALLTSALLSLSYFTALKVSSLDRVLAYVGSTGSTTISFILPGLFYYKISDPESVHHQRLTKEDDDADNTAADVDEDGLESSGGGLMESVASLGSVGSAVVNTAPWSQWRLRNRWRWDLEHLETGLLRKMAAGLAIYGFCVMGTCLIVNTFFVTSGGH
jgi:hypothetical protein